MAYRCGVCDAEVPTGQKMRRHLAKREDGSIEREIPVCEDCSAGFRSGYDLPHMLAIMRPKKCGKPAPLVKRIEVPLKAAPIPKRQ